MDLAPWIVEYSMYLEANGYAAKTIGLRLGHLSCLNRFIGFRGMKTLEEFEPELESDFIDYWIKHHPKAKMSRGFRRKSRSEPHHHPNVRFSLHCFFRWAHETGRLQRNTFPLAPVRGNYFFPEIADYLHFCKEHKRISDDRWVHIEVFVRRLDQFMHSVPLTAWNQLQIRHIDDFVRQHASHNIGRIQYVHSILRGLFRYLFSLDLLDRDWASALQSPRRYALAHTPRTLSPEQVLCLLRSIDRTHRGGKRDFAIILLAASLGVRAGEIAALSLDDLDWGQAVVSSPPIKRKSVLPLPLSRPLITALVDYLKNERRAGSPYRSVFLAVKPPFRPLIRKTVSLLIVRRMRRAGIQGSAHWLRHSFAGEVLKSGVSFSTLQELLGHSHFSSTQIYTKIDLAQLREVAQNDAEDM
jgi:site-specific recombinase XerD